MMDKEILVDVVGGGESGGCGCGGGCACAGGKSETEQVLGLNAAIRKQRKDIQLRYHKYQEHGGVAALVQLIDEAELQLPVTFINGKPAFQSGLPSVADILAAVAELGE